MNQKNLSVLFLLKKEKKNNKEPAQSIVELPIWRVENNSKPGSLLTLQIGMPRSRKPDPKLLRINKLIYS